MALMPAEWKIDPNAEPEKVTFHLETFNGVERVTVDSWPHCTLASARFIEDVDDGFLSVAVDGSTITITVANGWAVYRVVEYEPYLQRYTLRLKEAVLDPTGADWRNLVEG